MSQPQNKPARATDDRDRPQPADSDFLSQMVDLGVAPLAGEVRSQPDGSLPASPAEQPEEDDRQLFLEALEELGVSSGEEAPAPPTRKSRARREKQLQRGQLRVEASLDLHGLTRPEALEKLGYFLDNAVYHQLQTLLVVTGKGGHSEAGPILRSAVEDYLGGEGHPAVIEWCQAPRALGGRGALVVFLRRAAGG